VEHTRLEHDHSPEAIAARLDAGTRHNYLRDWIYGGIDGAVTTFAVVSGVVGAELSTRVILILGAANLLGDGFSMAAANYVGTRSERDHIEQVRAVERHHIDVVPEGEREELRQIFQRKGFDGEDLEKIVAMITSDRERWVETMLVEEHGLPLEVRSPLVAAASTMAAFVVCGLVPLIPWVLELEDGFVLSSLLTGIVFFLIGSSKSHWSLRSWWRLGLETLAIGAVAAYLAYGIGALLKDAVPA
jgi:VIT1/CCC1 family predicted Fe2+/Mn2+ transporter